MKEIRFLILLLIATVFVGTISCSQVANVNGSNTQASNVANAAPTPNTPTPTPENQSENVRKLIGDLASALMKGDTDSLDKIYSDEYILITDTGQITTKPERMVMIKSGDLKFEKVDFEEVSVRVYGNIAVAIARALATSTLKGKTQTAEERITFVAAKDGDAWRFISAQMTPIRVETMSENSKNSGGSNRSPANSSLGSTSGSNKQ